MTLPAPAPAPAPLALGLRLRLSVMMFLQYAIWGAWLPLIFPFLTEHRGLTPAQVGNIAAVGALGAVVAPFAAGQIADRWLATERFLALCHLLGAVLVWQLARLQSYGGLLALALLYSLLYAPTLALTNSIAFHHLPDRDRDFGRVRVWGTIGWIAAGIAVAQWLRLHHTPSLEDVPPVLPAEQARLYVRGLQVAGMADAFRLSAILGGALGFYSLALPHTPPQRGRARFAPAEALREVRRQPLIALFLVAFPISCVHQFYFAHAAGFLGHLKLESALLKTLFGEGGGGLMTIGQISEIGVLAAIPWFARRYSRKTLLAAGLAAYALRFTVFAYLPHPALVVPALALHGVCFGAFIFVAFMIVDEETTPDVRASAQGLFNLVVVGFGVIAGNLAAGLLGERARLPAGSYDYRLLFGIPFVVSLLCLLALVAFYPPHRRGRAAAPAP